MAQDSLSVLEKGKGRGAETPKRGHAASETGPLRHKQNYTSEQVRLLPSLNQHLNIREDQTLRC